MRTLLILIPVLLIIFSCQKPSDPQTPDPAFNIDSTTVTVNGEVNARDSFSI